MQHQLILRQVRTFLELNKNDQALDVPQCYLLHFVSIQHTGNHKKLPKEN